MDLHEKELGDDRKINSCLNNLMQRLRLKEIIGSLFKFLIISTAGPHIARLCGRVVEAIGEIGASV